MLSRNSKVLQIANRSHFTADSARGAQTEVVLLHAGQPWNEFHAKEYLKSQSALRFRAPEFVHNTITNAKLLNNSTIPGAISAYKSLPSLEVQIDRLAERIEESLDTVIPEDGPFKVSRLFHFDSIPFSKKLAEIQSNRPKNLVFFPLYPHFLPQKSGILLAESAKIIEKSSRPMIKDNREVWSSRIEQNSDYSYDIQAIWRWDNHSILADYWSSKLSPLLNELDAVVFAVPREFSCSIGPIYSSCERTINQLGDVIPWRIGFYSTWDSFDIPTFHGVEKQVEKFKNFKNGRIGIVPITHVFETFDTFYTIPQKIKHLKNAEILHPDHTSEKLVHGISEIVKNRLLGRKDRQLEVACGGSTKQLESLRIFEN